ncbi:MAG: YncE family protein [Paenibacillus sp.]|nr:YncE family protein [Paenibacillus sp.]
MKRKMVIGLSGLVLVVGLTACGNGANTKQNSTLPTNNDQTVLSNNTSGQNDGVLAEGGIYYTANEGGSISKIDAVNNVVIETIRIDGSVHNVQISPDGKTVGVTVVPEMPEMSGSENNHNSEHAMNGYAIFYDTATNKKIHQVNVGLHPAHIVFTEDNKYTLISNNEDNNVTVLDAKTHEEVAVIPTGNGPHGFRVSADSKFAYVANMNEDTVSVLNLQTMKEERKITVGKSPVTTGVTSDGQTLIATLNAEDAVAIVDLASGSSVKVPVGAGPAQVFVQSDDKYAIVANQGTEKNPSNSISKIDLNTKQVVTTIETGKGAHGVVTSKDNTRIYVTNMFDNTVSVIDNQENKVITQVKVGTTPNGISFMP